MTSALLIVTLILSLIACEKNDENKGDKDDTGYIPDQSIDVIIEPIEYTDESAKVRFTDIGAKLFELHYGKAPSEKQKNSISAEFKKTLIPIFYRVRIYEKECDTLLTLTENTLEGEITEKNFIESLFSLYNNALSTLGTERGGKLTYEVSLKVMQTKAKSAREKYENYDYPWHLDEAERCERLVLELTDMGYGRFISAISTSAFIISLLSDIEKGESDSSLALTDEEFLAILNRQGESFMKEKLTEEEWSILGGLISEIIPERAESFEGSMLYTLKTERYIISLSRVMPSVVELYAAVTEALHNEGSFSYKDKAGNAYYLSSALLASADALRSLDASMKQNAVYSSESALGHIESAGLGESYSAFKDEYTSIDIDGFISRLSQMTKDSDYEEIKSALISYLSSISPEITFTAFRE